MDEQPQRGLLATVQRWGGLIRLRFKLAVRVTKGFLVDFDLGILISVAFAVGAVAVCDEFNLEVRPCTAWLPYPNHTRMHAPHRTNAVKLSVILQLWSLLMNGERRAQ